MSNCPLLRACFSHIDTRVVHFFLLQSAWMPISIIIVYLVLVLKILPFYMKDRPPFNLRKIIMVYNMLQIVLNIIIPKVGFQTFYEGLDVFCADIDYSESSRGYRELLSCYLFYVTKILDLADTIFFVLKKNYRQVTYLHLYHHSAVLLMAWFIVRYAGGGHSLWAGCFNCFSHACMYSYYLLTAYDKSYKKNLTIKKGITILQMIQFGCFIFFFTTAFFRSCNYPKIISLILVPQNIYFLYLFMEFYRSAYKNKPQQNGNIHIAEDNKPKIQ